MTRALILISISVLTLSGCGGDEHVIGRGDLDRSDLTGSCGDADGDGDFCGGPSSGSCWCDDECDAIGDCCDDKASVCDGDPPTTCEDAHVPCTAGDPNCHAFGMEHGLTFDGLFLEECNDGDLACPGATTCVIPPCGADDNCPGLCVAPECRDATTCSSMHTACSPGDADCWEFGAAEGLTFEGQFVPECNELDTDCPADGICAFDRACGLDAPCPGLCVDDMECLSADACAAPHTPCDPGSPDCVEFGPADGLTFAGHFVPECFEITGECTETTSCVPTSTCGPGDPDPCPGLCVEAICLGLADECVTPHTACMPGDPGCWEFGPDEGLAFPGFFLPECDESDTTCDGTTTCAFDPACGLDSPCPGLCVADDCRIVGAECAAVHTECMPGDPPCWDFGILEGLVFEGRFLPECDEFDTACEGATSCAFNPACGLDAPCPGLCVADDCRLE
jgi:hypothetical protein